MVTLEDVLRWLALADGRPMLLDLFCCAGGAARGYQCAGFFVIGVDIAPQPHYAGDIFIQADALDVLRWLIEHDLMRFFAAAHASPPCQDYSRSKHISHKKPRKVYPRLIAPTRALLAGLSLPWIIENVEDAYPEMPDSICLCGTSFGLRVWRHRLFSSNFMLYAAGPCRHRSGDVSVRRQHCEYIGISSGVTYTDAKGYVRRRPKTALKAVAEVAMGIDWMTMDELGEAIPPAYTEWLGKQLMNAIEAQAA